MGSYNSKEVKAGSVKHVQDGLKEAHSRPVHDGKKDETHGSRPHSINAEGRDHKSDGSRPDHFNS